MILEMPLDTKTCFEWMPDGCELRADKTCLRCFGKGVSGLKLNVQGNGSVTVRQPLPCKCAKVFIPAETDEQKNDLKNQLDEHYDNESSGRLCQCLWCKLRSKIIEAKKKRGEIVPKN